MYICIYVYTYIYIYIHIYVYANGRLVERIGVVLHALARCADATVVDALL